MRVRVNYCNVIAIASIQICCKTYLGLETGASRLKQWSWNLGILESEKEEFNFKVIGKVDTED